MTEVLLLERLDLPDLLEVGVYERCWEGCDEYALPGGANSSLLYEYTDPWGAGYTGCIG